MAIDLEKLKLPAISEAGLQVLELLASGDIDFINLADYIAKDPALSATMIKYANSPLYRRSVEVTNVRNAVNLLGLKVVKMAVSVAMMRSFSDPPNRIKEMVWSHSISVSTIAKIIAQKVYPGLSDDIEMTGLMHDMGMLIFATNFPKEYEALLETSVNENIPMSQLEREHFGFAHDEIMPLIGERLRIPDVTVDTIRHFHQAEPLMDVVTMKDRHTVVTQMAHLIVEDYNPSGVFTEELPNSRESLEYLLELTPDEVDDLVEECEVMLSVL